MQKQRFRLYRRNGTYYAHESDTGKQTSLRAKDKTEAVGLLAARNQAVAQPILNVAMAKVYFPRRWGALRGVVEAIALLRSPLPSPPALKRR